MVVPPAFQPNINLDDLKIANLKKTLKIFSKTWMDASMFFNVQVCALGLFLIQ